MSESFKVGEAPWEKPERTANSARPSSLSSPVPQKNTPQPTPEDAPPAMPVGEAPWETQASTGDQPIPEDQFAPEPGFVQANMQQFQNLGDRVMYGLSANNNEAMAKLQAKYGPQNVTMRKGNIYFRKDATQKFKPIDPDQFEIFADLIPDGARNIIMEAAMLPGEALGALGGSTAGPGGTGVGAVAGRMASVPMATAVAEGVNRLVGIPQDPEPDPSKEALIGMAVEGVIPAVGGPIVRGVAKRLPGTQAYKMAKDAAKKEVVALDEMGKGVQESVSRLQEMGLKNGLNLYQTHPHSPATKAMVMKVADQPEFHKIQMDAAEDVANFTDNLFREIKRQVNPEGPLPEGNIGKSIRDTIQSLDKKEAERIGKYRAKAMAKLGNAKMLLPEETSQNVVSLMRDLGFQPKTTTQKIVRKVKDPSRPGSTEVKSFVGDQGRSYTDGVLRGAAMGPGAQKLVQTTRVTPGLASKQRIVEDTVHRQTWVKPQDMSKLAGRLGLDEGQTRIMVNALDAYGQYVSRGNEARLSDVEQLINRLGPMTQKLRGTQGGAHLSKIVGELRQHRRQIIGDALEKGSYEDVAFNTAMDEFKLIRNNVDDLSAVLDNDLANDAVVKYFFAQNKSPERRSALKAILGEKSHQWNALREAAIDRMMIEHADRTDLTRYNGAKFFESLKNQYGDEMMRDLFPDQKSIQALKDTFNYIDRFQRYSVGVRPDQASGKAVNAGTDALVGATFGVKFKMLNGISKLLNLDGGKENALLELYNRDGFHKYIDNYKGPGNKKEIAAKIEYLLSVYNSARAAQNKINTTLDIGKDITKRAVRADIREDASR